AENNWAPSLQHNDSAISSTFYGIMEKYDSAKMVSMAENDCFSTVENLQAEKAGWLYFCTWYDGGSADINFLSNPMFNTEEDTIAMYQSDYCITLDELPENLYTRETEAPDPSKTTTKVTTTTTTADPSITTTTTTAGFKFEALKYPVKLPEGSKEGAVLKFTIDGAATASIGGGFGYAAGPTPDDWKNIEWKDNADADGKIVYSLDLSEVPDDVTSGELQIWWSNVWDASIKKGIDNPCELADYEIIKTDTPAADVLAGDANCDGTVNLSDAVLIMQALANPDKYGIDGTDETHITAQGKKNADCAGGNDGMTNNDALAIQSYLLKLVDKLPIA
ncbi:MAG: dockerin type I repeat-containing protein, partial [Ruminococcus sp.]|nr:dockerin type I repeat-containing protein [Ruminococcus sp.]